MPPENRTVTVDGVTTEYTLSGGGGPVIILLNGFRMPLSSWDRLYPEIENLGRILAYNRHGIGKTSRATCNQSGNEIIAALERVLAALNLPPPYILVAHSLGGIFANLYARLKPENLSAVVFIDAAHPEEKQRQEDYKPPLFIRFITATLKAIDKTFDEFQHSEDECVAETVQQIEVAGDFPSLPVAVVTGGRKMPFVPNASMAIHLQCQKELTILSPSSRQIVAHRSGHFPHLTEPELVLQTIRNVIEQVEIANNSPCAV